jgi:hypothetical protein
MKMEFKKSKGSATLTLPDASPPDELNGLFGALRLRS